MAIQSECPEGATLGRPWFYSSVIDEYCPRLHCRRRYDWSSAHPPSVVMAVLPDGTSHRAGCRSPSPTPAAATSRTAATTRYLSAMAAVNAPTACVWTALPSGANFHQTSAYPTGWASGARARLPPRSASRVLELDLASWSVCIPSDGDRRNTVRAIGAQLSVMVDDEQNNVAVSRAAKRVGLHDPATGSAGLRSVVDLDL